MIRETLDYIGKNYLAAAAEPFAKHPVADYLRDNAPSAIAEALGNKLFIVEGSPGKGRWAPVPWICIFDPTVTESATRGYYVVYLFGADMKAVHLCLAQGITSVRDDFKTNSHDALRRYAGVMRDRLPEAKGHFSPAPVLLHGHTDLSKDYEPSIALSKSYTLNLLPQEANLQNDLKEMARLYSMLIARGGRDTFEDVVTKEETKTEGDTIIERRRYRQHRKLERNSSAGAKVKALHGYICQCCGFDFQAVFGALGAEYIEAYHLTPLSELPEDVPVSQDPERDFAVLCGNCHRMIHRKEAPKTVEGLRELPGVAKLNAILKSLE
jgi:5-methylcytosine-specific restriction protein A